MTRSETTAAGNIVAPTHRSWRRRRYVVDARYQLRAGVLVGVVAVALLILLNIALLAQDGQPGGISGASVPHRTAGPDGGSWALLMIGSVVFVAGVIAVGVLESHRTAGAAYAIRRSVDQIRAGQSGVRVRLRRGDHLQELAASVNQLAESLDADRAARS